MVVRAAAALALLAFIVVPAASGEPARSSPIRLGVGIGPINLGMTGQQVRRALGPPAAVLERRTVRGQRYIELQWGYGRWNIGLVGPKGRRRVVLIGTELRRHRTPQGLGVGSTDRQLTRHLRIRQRSCNPNAVQWYTRHGRSETVFIPRHEPVLGGPGVWREVIAVEVRGDPTTNCGVY